MNATLTETEPILIARTNKKERVSVNHGQVWWEYRIRHLEQHERPADGPDWGSEWALEQRRCEDGDEAKDYDWIVYNFGNTPEKAISGVMGDSSLSKANSLHPLHAQAVGFNEELRSRQAKAQKANLLAANAKKAVEDYKAKCNAEYRKKAEKIEDETKRNDLFEGMKAKLKPELDRLKVLAAQADMDNQDAAYRVNIHLDMEFDHGPVSETLQKILDGGNAVVSEPWLEDMVDLRHNISQYIRSCKHRNPTGTKHCGEYIDCYVAWIYNTGKPADLEMKPDMTVIGSPS